MNYNVSPCLERALATWAAQKRMVYLTTESQSVASVLGRIKSERVAAGEGGDARSRQRWPEVYSADGFMVELVVRTLKELPRLTLTYHYLLRSPWRVPISAQAADIGIPKREYWRQLDIAETAVDTGLQVMEIGRKTHSASAHQTEQRLTSVFA